MINVGLIGHGIWGKNYEKSMKNMGFNFIISTKLRKGDFKK